MSFPLKKSFFNKEILNSRNFFTAAKANYNWRAKTTTK